MEIKNAFCKNCQKNVKMTRKSVNHILHLLLSLVTFGAWVIPWILISIFRIGGWKCDICGTRFKGTFEKVFEVIVISYLILLVLLNLFL